MFAAFASVSPTKDKSLVTLQLTALRLGRSRWRRRFTSELTGKIPTSTTASALGSAAVSSSMLSELALCFLDLGPGQHHAYLATRPHRSACEMRGLALRRISFNRVPIRSRGLVGVSRAKVAPLVHSGRTTNSWSIKFHFRIWIYG